MTSKCSEVTLVAFAALLYLADNTNAGSAFSKASSPYIVDVWMNDEGLPQNTVNSIVQTRDGYLWIATGNGLARFDGVRLKVFDAKNTPQLKSSKILKLFEDLEGRLWIGTEGGGLTQFEAGQFSSYTTEQGLSDNVVTAICEDQSGALWVGTLGGVDQFQHGQFTHYTIQNGLPSNLITVIEVDRGGKVWAGTSDGLCQFINGAFRVYRQPYDANNHVLRLWPAKSEDALYVSFTSGRVLKLEGGEFFEEFDPKVWESAHVKGLLENGAKDFWMGSYGNGLFRLKDQTWERVLADGLLTNDHVMCLYKDREGDLWIGTNGEGLKRVKERLFQMYDTRDGLSQDVALSIYGDQAGAIWVGSNGAGLSCLRRNMVKVYGETDGLLNSCIWSLCEDRAGQLWVGTDGSGLFRFKDGRFAQELSFGRYTSQEGLSDLSVMVLHGDHKGDLWIGTKGGGLYLLHNGQFTHYGRAEGLVCEDVRAIQEDSEGNLWVGTSGGGLNRLKNGQFSGYRTRDGLAHDKVWSILAEDDGTVWIGTYGGGLSRYKGGRFTTYTTREGLPDDVICQILDDGLGRLWMSSYKGIFEVSKRSFSDFDSGRTKSLACVLYDKSDGLSNRECTGGFQPAGWKTKDGRLWFPTIKGVAVVDPRFLRTESQSTPVVIEEMVVDGQPLSSRGGRVTVGPGKNQYSFQYTGLSLATPERVKFKYQLRGFDANWIDAGAQRFAHYGHVPPGNYEFRVIASNSNGAWNEAGASVQLAILPYFWQTWWFRVFAALVCGGSIACLVRYGLNKKLQKQFQRLEHQRALDNERLRISRDIHDDLGARLTEVLLLSDLAQRNKTNATQVEVHVGKISNAVRDLVRNLDAIVWAVNPKNDFLDSLANYIFHYVEKYLGMTSIRCRLDVPDELPHWPLSSEVRHNLFLVIKEALNNIVKHSDASEVRVRIRTENSTLAIAIEDNGKGFLATAMPSRGNGLKNMERRVRDIGGQFELRSQVGRGTEVEVHMHTEKPGDQRCRVTHKIAR